MERRTKVKIVAGIGAALVLAIALGAAGAVAAARVLASNDESQAVIDDAAGRLGIEPSALSDALKEALKSRVDAAVEAGRLTEEQGTRLKARIDSGEIPLVLGGFGHRGFGKGLGFGHVRGIGSLDAAASYLELTEGELRERLADGKTLAEIAREKEKSVDGLVQALTNAAEKNIDDAVASGRLAEERAAKLEEGLEERMTELVDRELRRPSLGRGFGHGLGFHGARPFAGPRG